MKKISYALFGISLFIFLVISFVFFAWNFYYKNEIIQENIFNSNVEVVKERSIGIDLGNDSLSYGRASPGTTVVRSINLKNDYGFPIIVEIKPTGEITEFLKYQNVSHVDKNEEEKISFVLEIPAGAEAGFYEGNISFLIKRSLR